jgi:hypothetical protein
MGLLQRHPSKEDEQRRFDMDHYPVQWDLEYPIGYNNCVPYFEKTSIYGRVGIA